MSSKSSIFSSSDSYYSLLVNQVYKSLMTGEWCSHASELAKFNRVDEDKVKALGKKSMQGYGELKKAFTDVLKALKERCPGTVEEIIVKKEKKVRYTGPDKDPFAEERSLCRQQTVEDYARFCKSSLGFLPPGWFSAFFEGTQQLGESRKDVRDGNVFIGATHEQTLRNIELLPKFYGHIEKQEVTSFDYATFGNEPERAVFHPQYIKEFNGRWFIIGPKEGSEYPVDVIPLDRIESPVFVDNTHSYRPATPGYYKAYFNDIVGVSHEKDRKLEHLVIKTRSRYVHGLMKTKPIHSSFKEVSQYESHADDKYPYGLISYDLEPNREFIGRILTFGPDLEVIEPSELREELRKKAERLAWRYGIRTVKKEE